MKRCLVVWFVAALIFNSVQLFGQTVEICNNNKDDNGNGQIDCADTACTFPANVEKGCRCFDGIDNDGDGKIDPADTDCATYYGLTFVGSGSTCSITPPGGNPFTSIAPPQTTQQNTADTPAKVVVGDINGDGVPDAAVCSKWNSTVQVIATATAGGFSAGDIMADFRTPGSNIFPQAGSKYVFEYEVMIADIDKDKKAEVFAIASLRGGSPNNPPTEYFLCAFKYTPGNLVPMYNAVDLGPDRPGNPGIADFDGDGKAEIYLKNRIYAAESGVKLADGGGNWDTAINAGPVAANITGSTNLELICGNLIYSVPSMSGRALVALTLIADMNTLGGPKFYPKGFNDLTEYGKDQASSTSTADFNGDGFLDVLMTGAINCSGLEASPCGNNITTIFYWDFHNGTVKTFAPPDVSTPDPNGWVWGTGRINLGDANGDGKLEALFIAGNQLYCLGLSGGNLTQLWVRTINDSKSGILSLTVYDFDNDGKPEVVYRDSQELAIVDGLTGATKKWSATCQSHTWTEGPVIADVNGDGGTDICVTCYTNASFNINSGIQQQSLGQTRLYYSSTAQWLPTRKVWNQHPYYVTNINDDLTLPFPQLDPALIFSNAPCPNGLPGPQRPFNIFMNQVPRLSLSGCPEFPAPDLTFQGDNPNNPGVDSDGDGVYTPAVVVIPPICGDLNFSAFFNIINNGDLPISDVVPVSFFNGDPTLNPVTAQLLLSTSFTITNLQVGQKLVTAPKIITGPGTVFELYIVIYNNGLSLPISLAGQSTKECTIANNIYHVTITPDPFSATIEKLADNFKCAPAAPNTGELRAHVFKGATETFDYSPYAFQWYTGVGTGSPIPGPGGTAYNLVGVAEGTYTLVVTNTLKNCKSTPVNATIIKLGNNPTINVAVLSDQTNCTPANGKLQASITDPGGNTGFTFTWFDVALTPLGITGPTASNLPAGSYVVLVSKDGCTKSSPPVTVNGPQIPDAQAVVTQQVVDCNALNNGIVKADAYFNSVLQNPANYTFDWYFYNNATSTRGSILPPANGTGQTRTGLAIGYYQAVVKEIASQCISPVAPVVQVLDQRVFPTAQITELAPQTSCDPAQPNGILQGDALIGGVVQNPATFTFEWFKGDNTLPAFAHTFTSGTNGQVANKVAGGNIYYTVRVTSATHCQATNKYIITETINKPVVTLTPTNNSICDPVIAGVAYNGSISAAVTFAGSPVSTFSNYKFTWHNGQLVTDPVIAVPDVTLPSLGGRNGGYYTVEAQRTDLFCTSIPVTVQVLNGQVFPVIVTNNTPSTNCTGPNNGILDAKVDLGGGVTTTTGYTFKWFKGNNIAAPLAGATPVVTGQQGGVNYTSQVINSSSGCPNTLTILLPDAKALPVITLTPAPNSICNPALTSPAVQFNGSVVAAATYKGVAVGSFADYTFAWHNGSLITDPVNGSSTTQNLTAVNGGFYTVAATIVSLGCTSSAVTSQVLNTQIIPVITTATIASTNCDPLLKNGKAEVTDVDTGGGIAAPYTFKWYDGVAVVPGSEKALIPAYNNVQGGAGKNYTVLVTNQSSGCQNNKTVLVADAKVLPLLTLATVPNSVCNPALTSPAVLFNGSVTATITNTTGIPGDYNFTWHDGALVTDPIDAGSTTTVLGNKNGGSYTVTTKHTPTGCVSSPFTAAVANTQIIPAITTATIASTNCTPALKNGQASVTDVDTGGGIAAPYTFKWYDGVSVVPGSEKSLIAVYNNVQGGAGQNYTVLVVNQTSGCQNNKTVLVADAKVLPVVTLSKTDNTRCINPRDGTAFINTLTYQAAAVASPYTGYTFSWNTGATTSTISALSAASYTITVTNTSVGCTSSPVSIAVNNNLFTPPINVAKTVQSSCDVANPNGILAATINETTIGGGAAVTAGYNFVWHKGSLITDPVVTTTTAVPGEVNQLKGNLNYTIETTRTSSGCTNTSSVFLNEVVVLPAVAMTTVTPLTRCDTPDGSILTTVTQIPVQTYTYFWMKEPTTSATTNPNTVITAVNASPAFPNKKITGPVAGNTDTFGNLIPGDYTIVVVDNYTTCISQPVTGSVVDNSLKSVITITLGPTFPSTCGVADGQMSASVAGGVGPYDLKWHHTGPTNSNINFFTNPPVFTPPDDVPFQTDPGVTSAAANGLASGVFTLVVKDVGNGCGNYETIFLPFINSHTVIPTLTPSTICPPTSGNGNVKTAVGNVAAGKTFQDYTYVLYTGENPDPTKMVGSVLGPGAAVTNPENFPSLLVPGMYTIEIRQAFSGLCPSYQVVEILQNALDPVVTLNGALTANTACDVLQADGSVSINIQKDPDDLTVGSTYTLNVNPLPVGGGYPVAGLPTGNRNVGGLKPASAVAQYTITVTSTNNCVTQRFVSIPDAPATSTLVAGNVTVTNAALCSPSGSIEVTGISITGAGADNLNNFQFKWFSDAALATNVFTAQGDNTAVKGGEFLDNTTFPTIGPGSFWTVATKNIPGLPGFGCTSAPFKSDINDVSIKPTINLAAFTNTACDTNYEGKATVQMSETGVGSGKLYTYVWDPANPTAIPTTVANNGNAINDGDGDNPINLKEGTYKVTATNNFTSCPIIGQITLLQAATPIVVANGTVVDKKLCTPDGSITLGANDVTVNGVADPIHTNFVFDWFLGSPVGVPIVTGNNIDVLNNVSYPIIGAGDYYVIATRAAGVPLGSGCKSAPLKKTINDLGVKPTVSLAAFANTACDVSYEGKITITASDASGPGVGKLYTYVWDPSNPVAIPTTVANNGNAINDGDGDNPTNLQEGTYIVKVTNNFTACDATGQISLLQAATPIVVANATVVDKKLCAPDGSIVIGANDVTVNGVADPVHGNFVFDWTSTSPTGTNVLTGSAADALNNVTFPAIVAGDYYVVATRKTGVPLGSGCKSPPLKKTITDITISPVVSFTTIANTACDNNFDAKITVLSSTPGGPGGPSNYDLTWTSIAPGATVANATNVGASYTTTALDIVAPGSYVVDVKNIITSCIISGTVSVLSNPQPLDILTVNKNDQTICYPDGSLQVSSLNSGVVGNYTYNWFKDDPANPPLVDAGLVTIVTPSLNVSNYATIGAGTYFVVATKNGGATPGSGCKTPPFRRDILDVHKDPRIAFSFTPNSSCDNLNPNATVLANASEQSGANGDTYTFAWTLNAAALPPVTTQTDTNNSSNLANGFEGTYKLDILNVTTTGCSFTSSLNVDLNLNISLPNIIGVNKTDPIDCLPSATASVSSVSIGGGPPISGAALTTNFTYEWYANNFAPADILPTTTPNIVGLSPISYFVLVQDNATKCKSGPREVKILDLSIVYPVVSISQTAKQISCTAITGTAALAATGDGQTDANPNYTFTWYPSLDITGVSFANTSAITNLLVGNYSVDVKNLTTNCTAFQLFIVPNDAPAFTPILATGNQPRTSCLITDGAILARVIDTDPAYPFPLSFTADLYLGSTPNLANPPDFPNMPGQPGFPNNYIQSNLPQGFYTVRLTDNNTGCTDVGTQEVEDQRKDPVVVIIQDNPSVNCDPTRLNGQLSATADSKVGGYTFDWYTGATVTAPPGPLLVSNNKLIGHGAGIYVVRATRTLSGCFADATDSLHNKTLKPPTPDPKVVFHRTSCLVPNGWVNATVGGTVVNYTFTWYDGPGAAGAPSFVGVDYQDRDIGPYTVTATDDVTGCVSKPATVDVLDKRVTPEFTLKTTPSYCSDVGKAQGAGSIELDLQTPDISLDNVSWYNNDTNAPAGTGSQVFGLFPGIYRAEAVTNEGCVAQGLAEVLTEIGPYNGMSVNGDNQNDNFIIDCITNFPNNNVKIFNRSGIMVYEVNGYNNADFSFRGVGEKGLYVQGVDLPVGTYFYIIDKRDGTRPLAGYLELTR